MKFRINFKILLITFKAIDGLAPMYVQDLISTKLNGRHTLRSSSEILLKPPACKTLATLDDHAFMVAAPKLWNAFAVNICDANNVDNFKRLLKTYFFKLAYT